MPEGGELLTDDPQPPDRLGLPSASSASSAFALVLPRLQRPHSSFLADNLHPARLSSGSPAPMPLPSHQPLLYVPSSGFQPLASQSYPGSVYRPLLTPYSPYSMSTDGGEDRGAVYSGQQHSGEGGLPGPTAAAGDGGVSNGVSSTSFAPYSHQPNPEHHPPQRLCIPEASWHPQSAPYVPHPPLPVDTPRTSHDEQSRRPDASPYGHIYPPAFWHHQQRRHSLVGTHHPALDLELATVYRPHSPTSHVPSFVPRSYPEHANPRSQRPPVTYSHPGLTSYSLLALATEQRHASSPTDVDAIAGPSRLIPSPQLHHPSSSFASPPPQPVVGLTLQHVATTDGSLASFDHSPVPSPDLAPGIVPPPVQLQTTVSHTPPQASSEQVSGLTKKRRAPKDAAVRKYACEECEQRFARPSALATHILTHTKEKPFVCSSCNRGFAVMSNLRRHCRVRNHILTASQASTVRPRGSAVMSSSNPFTFTSAYAPPEDVELDPMNLPDVTDLPPGVPSLSTDDLVPVLRARFLEGLPYTNLSPRLVVSVNPGQFVHANSDQTLADYSAEYADCGADGVRGRMGPHVWATAQKAYYYMRRTGQDQTLVLSGETGSGKTETSRLILKALSDLAAPPPGKRGAKLSTSIPAAFFILDTFGSATTLANTNASRFGRYTELQFNEKGRLMGLKGLEYFLEKSRVSATPAGERNFHVFHYLVGGASQDEREHLKLESNASAYRYLAHARSSAAAVSSDATRFSQLKEAFKTVGFPKKAVASICQILAAVLHLGNIEFHMDRRRNADSALVKNTHVLETAADFLGVDAAELEYALTNKSTLVGGEVCAVFLDAESASGNRDALAQALYGLVFSWIGEFLNEKLCRDDFTTFISILDFPGPIQLAASHRDGLGVEAFCFNLAAERVQGFVLEQLFEANKAEYAAEELSLPGLNHKCPSNSETVRLLTNMPGGLVHIIDDQSRRRGKTPETMLRAMAKRWGSHPSFTSRDGDEAQGRPGTFSVSHFDGQVTYSTENFLADNSAAVSPNFVTLLGGTTPKVGVDGRTTSSARDALSTGGSSLSFVRQLFSSGAVETKAHPKSEETIVGASQKVGPRRTPSTRKPRGKNAPANPFTDSTNTGAGEDDGPEMTKLEGRSVVQEVNDSLTLLANTLNTTKPWFVFCLRPNDAQLPNQVDAKLLKHQIRALGLADFAKRLQGEWTVNLELKEWWERYGSVPVLQEEQQALSPLVYRDKAIKVKELLGFSDKEMGVGKNKVFLSDAAFRYLEDFLRADDPDELARNREAQGRQSTAVEDPYSPYAALLGTPVLGSYNVDYAKTTSTAALPLVDSKLSPGGSPYADEDDYDRKTFFNEADDYFSDPARQLVDEERSLAPSGYASSRPMFDARNMPEKVDVKGEGFNEETVEVVRMSSARKRWLALTWLFTWWVPSPFLNWCGGMKRKDVRMAWREKLLINMLIWLLCGVAIFVIAVLGNLICPKEYIYNTQELNDHSYTNDPDNMLVAIRGEVFDLTSFAPHHVPGNAVIPTKSIQKLGGTDLTNYFPVQVSALCNGVDGTVSPWVTLEATNISTSISNVAKYHDFRASTTDSRPDWYYEMMVYLRYNYRKGFMGYSDKTVSAEAKKGSSIAIYDGSVYDLSTYVQNGGGGISVPDGATVPDGTDRSFMSDAIVSLFTQQSGQDITNSLNSLNLDADTLARQKICLRNLFFIGKVDNRNSAQCRFSQYILIALSCIMVAIVGFKFLAALQFGRKRKPEDYDKFVILQVPCYTEGEESLRNCIDSLTKLKYDDKRKLLCIICDGMIVGSGNDRPTPQIVLDILGADPTVDPEPLSFQSIGDGAKQHNMAKVYSGLHEAGGHIVPYIVIVKVGKPTERARPGNRGKRDSQMLLMRFLNRVHFDSPMAPAELEIYHQIKNVIGVNPSFYEYLLMVDADTTVDPFSLNYLVGGFVEDRKIIGLCGETSLSNARASWTTMMQVYEYFISHHLAKAFESLFGSVTCLPGCFSMYRIRTLEHKPLIIADAVLAEYGENKVETLHVKNLLSLGEDRYLTTVILKNFSQYKLKFTRHAKAQTIAPDEWKVLMSQRRRWINSTIHNLVELLFIDRMCGFCCFSMRFVVLVDLASTLISPVTVAYIGYLIYLIEAEHKPIPTFALIMLGAIYGCQVVIYVLHRKFEHIGWMLVYLLALPFFSFILPIVSFWQMDDFSWGSTREIMGEGGKRMVVHDEGKFDPASIPLKTWSAFEEELWEAGSNESIGEIIDAGKREEAASAYGMPYGAASVRDDSPRRYTPGGYDHKSAYGTPSISGSITMQPAPAAVPYGHPGAAGSVYGGSYSQLPGQHQPYPSMGGRRESTTSYFAANALAAAGMGGTDARGSQGGHAYTPSNGSPRAMSPAPHYALSGAGVPGLLPSDEQLQFDVHEILRGADLQTLTKKGVRQELEARYGAELTGDKKALVNRVISDALGLA
ncbi:hypothetical protein JCM21900_003288 [Sporobolomyces salmonicolor]